MILFILQNWYIQFEVKVKQEHRIVRTILRLSYPLCCSAKYNVTVIRTRVTEMQVFIGLTRQAVYVQTAHFVGPTHTIHSATLKTLQFSIQTNVIVPNFPNRVNSGFYNFVCSIEHISYEIL